MCVCTPCACPVPREARASVRFPEAAVAEGYEVPRGYLCPLGEQPGLFTAELSLAGIYLLLDRCLIGLGTHQLLGNWVRSPLMFGDLPDATLTTTHMLGFALPLLLPIWKSQFGSSHHVAGSSSTEPFSQLRLAKFN